MSVWMFVIFNLSSSIKYGVQSVNHDTFWYVWCYRPAPNTTHYCNREIQKGKFNTNEYFWTKSKKP